MGRKDRHTWMLAATLGLLALCSLGLRWWDGRTTPQEDSLLPLFRALRQDQVAVLKVDGPDGLQAEMTRDGDRWLLDGSDQVLADAVAVQSAIQKLVDLPRGRILQPDARDLERFGLAGPGLLRVTALDENGAVLVDLGIGEVLEGATYLLPMDEQVVRRVDTNVRSRFTRPELQGWRDRSIVSGVAPEDVRRIRVEAPTFDLVLVRGPDAASWRLEAPVEAEAVEAQVDPLLRQVTRLAGERFYGGPLTAAELGLDPPSLVVTVEREDGPPIVLHVGDRLVEGGYAVRRPDQEPTWLVARFRAEILRRDPRQYLPR